MRDQVGVKNLGGTLRLGLYPCVLKPGSVAAKAYDNAHEIEKRHRHRYEFNTKYRKPMEEKGLVFSGVSPDDRLMEIIEYPKNKFFVASQYHPEFQSRPNKPEGLFKAAYTPIPKRAGSRSLTFSPCFLRADSLNLYIECMANGSWLAYQCS